MTRKIDSYMDRAIRRGARPTACSEASALPAELLVTPRIPRAPKVPAFSLYPMSSPSRRPAAPPAFVASSEPAAPSWSALANGLAIAETTEEPRVSTADVGVPLSRLARARAYLNDPRGAANALGLGAAAGLIVVSFMLFACK